MADIQPTSRLPAPFGLVVVTTSLGGLPALAQIVSDLPEQFDVPIAVTHHRSPTADDRREVWLLQQRTRLPVRIAAPGHRVLTTGITVIPAGQRATFTHTLRYRLAIAASADERRTCGDALLASAADHLGPRVIAVVLTGGLDDGSAGVRVVKRRGGRVLAQDPRTARAAGMPTSAIATGCIDFIVPLERMGAALTSIAVAPGGADLFAVATPSWARLHA